MEKRSLVIKYFLLISGIWFLLNLPDQSPASDLNFRKYAGEFMEIGVDARAQAMGGAFTAISGGVTSSYYNPAGMMNLAQPQISFMHTQQMIASVNYDFLAFGFRQDESRVLTLSIIRLGVDHIKDSRQAQRIISQTGDWNIDWSKITEFNASDYVLSLSVAQRWKKSWSWGANLKFIHRDLADHSAKGIGFDLGIQRKVWGEGLVGINVKNITTTLISWDTGEKELVSPAAFLGAGYNLHLPKLNSYILPVIDLIFRAENRQESAATNLGAVSLDYAAGLEYAYYQTVFLRAGVDEIQRPNFGIGLKIPHIRIDYAFTSYQKELGNSHRVGLLVTL